MRQPFQLIRISGIGIHVHWTFLILVAWFMLIHLSIGGPAGAVRGLLLLLAIFACVVLHELGHALTARQYGIRTRDITLYPIGGVARLDRIPEDPQQELMIALAGPAVNFIIAAVLAFAVLLIGAFSPWSTVASVTGPFLQQLMWLNIFIAVFNLLPAFPMDGGRVLRALLARRLKYVHATDIAAKTGQFVAILFGIIGLLVFNVFLVFIALFVFVGAQAEAHSVMIRSVVRGVPVRAAMLTQFQRLSPTQTLGDAADAIVAGSQQDFPVFAEGELAGLLFRSDLMAALAERERDTPISEIMNRDVPTVVENSLLEDLFEQMQQNGLTTIPVTRAGEVVGLVTLENVGEWVMIQSAIQRHERSQADDAADIGQESQPGTREEELVAS